MFRAPFLPKQHLHLRPGMVVNTSAYLVDAPFQRRSASLLGPITPLSPITPRLPADRGFANPDYRVGILLPTTCFHRNYNLISLLLGKLRVVTHVRPSDFGRNKKATMLPQPASPATIQSWTRKLKLRISIRGSGDNCADKRSITAGL